MVMAVHWVYPLTRVETLTSQRPAIERTTTRIDPGNMQRTSSLPRSRPTQVHATMPSVPIEGVHSEAQGIECSIMYVAVSHWL